MAELDALFNPLHRNVKDIDTYYGDKQRNAKVLIKSIISSFKGVIYEDSTSIPKV